VLVKGSRNLQVPEELEGCFLYLLLVDQRVHPRCSEGLQWYSLLPTLGENNFVTAINHLLVFFAERMLFNINKAELVELAKKMRAAASMPKKSLKQKRKAPVIITQAPTEQDEDTTFGLAKATKSFKQDVAQSYLV